MPRTIIYYILRLFIIPLYSYVVELQFIAKSRRSLSFLRRKDRCRYRLYPRYNSAGHGLPLKVNRPRSTGQSWPQVNRLPSTAHARPAITKSHRLIVVTTLVEWVLLLYFNHLTDSYSTLSLSLVAVKRESLSVSRFFTSALWRRLQLTGFIIVFTTYFHLQILPHLLYWSQPALK